jgi:hypothetical protein
MEGRRPVCVNVKGTHGSGKSSLCRSLLESDPARVPLRLEGWKMEVATYSPRWNALVLGAYPQGRGGGCDHFHSTKEVKYLLNLFWDHDAPNLVYEGILVSSIRSPMLEFMLYLNAFSKAQREISYCFLDTPLSECLSRIYQRNGGRQINERIVASKHSTIARHAAYYRASGIRCEVLDTSGSKQEVFERFTQLFSLGSGSSNESAIRGEEGDNQHGLCRSECGRA